MELVTVPDGVATDMGPLVAPTGTVVTIFVAVVLRMGAVVPLKVTVVAPNKPAPLIVTLVPGLPEVGLNEVIVAARLMGNGASDSSFTATADGDADVAVRRPDANSQ